MRLIPGIRNELSETFRSVLTPQTVFIWLASVVLATISGPFETDEFGGWPVRTAFWLMIVSLSIVIGCTMRVLSGKIVGSSNPVLSGSMMVALMTVFFTPVVWLITQLVLLSSGQAMPSYAKIAGYVMLCTTVFVIGRRLSKGFETLPTHPGQRIKESVDAQGEGIAKPRLLRRLSPEVQSEILRLTANDHFVEVTTRGGSESLRMRLADAIDEMEPVSGYCVHRSHWVAHCAVSGVERESSNKLFVVLANGDRIPVSRKYQVNVKDAGWL